MELRDMEIDALAEQPHHLLPLYVGIKRRMGSSGLAEFSPADVADILYVRPRPGRTGSGSPSRKAARHALSCLAELGLIQPVKRGVYALPMAQASRVVPLRGVAR
tara:strand:+ start:481 stop:795 length:315 start_codon:yes stop_codon:yes gene_type:complete